MAFIDPIFNPLLKFPILWIVIGLSFLVSVLVTLIYKFTTNQSLMKKLKDEIKSYQEQIKSERNNPARAMELNKKAMQVNFEYMSHSMRSTLFTFIPVILLFGWMSSHLAFSPIIPHKEFTVTTIFAKEVTGNIEIITPEGINLKDDKLKEIKDGIALWKLEGEKGGYNLEFNFNNENHNKELIISEENSYAEPLKKIKDSQLKQIVIGNEPIKLLNIFGWKIGWLGTYIITSIIFSIVLRKVLKVY
ncbi:MAG: EMC3/TMCO1 family protein [Nanoarchaeota archaeon]